MKLALPTTFFLIIAGMHSAVSGVDEDTAHDATGKQESSSAAESLPDVIPLLKSRCFKCHNNSKPEAELSLERFASKPSIEKNYEVWEKVLKMLAERQMPPEDQPQPTEVERQTAIRSLQRELSKFDCSTAHHPGRVTVRRLNRPEYNNTLRDLLRTDLKPADDFPNDDVGEGFDNIADVLTIPPVLMEKYLAAAEKVIDATFADTKLRARIVLHQPSETVRRSEAARRNIADFVGRAFRRPITDGEEGRLTELHRLARDQGCDGDEALKVVLQAVLASPSFLFRIERDPEKTDDDGIRELDGYELASRVSYFLWSSMPDEQLFAAAKDNTLHRADVISTQVRRMLADPKSRALVDNFAGQWLQLRDLGGLAPDPEKYPDFDESLRSAMRRETELLFESMIREDRSVLDFLVADYSYVNERLARHYGIDGVKGDEFQRVVLPQQRRGVLTHGSILLLTSNPTRTSPVKRGKWILDNILGEPPPPPPAGVVELDEEAETLGSLRERMEQHRANESCAVCHKRMDVLGFGLENFDGIGAWRSQDGKFAIDASGALPGGAEFKGPKELMEILKQQKKAEFCRCLASKMLTYALGRGLQASDRCAVDLITKQLEAEQFRFSSLVTAIVSSEPFRFRASLGE